MKYLGPTSRPRLNEAVAVVFLFAGLFFLISLASYDPLDPSWNTATFAAKPVNLMGRLGAILGDFLLQAFGYRGVRDPDPDSGAGVELGALVADPDPLGQGGGVGHAGRRDRALHSDSAPTGILLPTRCRRAACVGAILADDLVASMNLTGAAMFTAVCWILGLYLVSTFEMSKLGPWFRVPTSWFQGNLSERHGRGA